MIAYTIYMNSPKAPPGKAKELLGKAVNPSILLSLVVSSGNAYVEFQDMRKVMVANKAQIHDLEFDNVRKTTELKELVEATRTRFKDNETMMWELRTAVAVLQTEARTHSPQLAARAHNIALEQKMREIVQRMDDVQPVDAPLKDVNF